MHKIILLAALTLALPFSAISQDTIGWPDSPEYPAEKSAVDMSDLNKDDIDKNGIVFIKDAHFWNRQGRLNLFGTNLTFDACFPDKDRAESIAAQLAGLGVNIVRLHHMDIRDIWGTNARDFKEFDPKQLDKLDYLVYCLKRRGIYIDLNLHVSWQYTGDKNDVAYRLIREEPTFKYGKGLDTFLPELAAKQKHYAAALLNHVNPYTRLAYKNDPVTALVEINNENSFYRNMLVQGGLDLLPGVYRQLLADRFHQFLRRKYDHFDNLRQAWSPGKNERLPLELPTLTPLSGENNWRVQISAPQKGTIAFRDGKTVIHLNDLEKNKFFQFYKTNLTFKKDADYTLVFDVEAKKGATFHVNAMRQNAPYENAGLDKKIVMTEDARHTFIIPFKPTKDLTGLGRITFLDFNKEKDFVIYSVKLYEGIYRIDPLHNVTRIDEIIIPSLVDYPAYPIAFCDDLSAFFRQTELNYWSGMIRYLKEDVGVKAPITGTQIDYSLPELAAIYDYIDVHAYWQHPSFPGNPWDPKNYYVRNVSMVSEPNTTFDRIALSRIKGKPFTISEYNHPYPNLHTAETPTMLAVVSKLQDYDGIFMFNYLNHLAPEPVTYFGHSAKYACKSVYTAAALIFRDPAVPCLPDEEVWNLGGNEAFNEFKQFKRYANPYLNELYQRPNGFFDIFKTKRFSLQLTEKGNGDFSKTGFTGTNPARELTWDNASEDYHRSFFKFDAAKAKAYIGWNIAGRYEFENAALHISGSPSRYFQFTLINRDGTVGQKGRYIMTLEGREFFSNINYFDYDTKKLLDLSQENYRAKIMAVPTAKEHEERIENYNAVLRLKLQKHYPSIAVYSINAIGGKEKKIPCILEDNELIIEMKQTDNTVVYYAEIGD